MKVHPLTVLRDNCYFWAYETSFDPTQVLITIHLITVLFDLASENSFDLTEVLIKVSSYNSVT